MNPPDPASPRAVPPDLADVVRPWHQLLWSSLALLILAITSARLDGHEPDRTYYCDDDPPARAAPFHAIGVDVVGIIGIGLAVFTLLVAIYRVERGRWPAAAVAVAVLPATYHLLHVVTSPVAPGVQDAAVLILLVVVWFVSLATWLRPRPRHGTLPP